jgi:hypothetical protein
MMVTGYRVAPLGHLEIERAAADVRCAFDLDPLMPIPGWQLFEHIGQLSVVAGSEKVPVSYGVEESLPTNALACAIYDEKANEISLVLSAQSYDDLERRNGYRARFSVAHEIGHAKLHAERLIQITRIDHTRRAMLRTTTYDTPLFQDSEWQANNFAAALLMPAPGLECLLLQHKLQPSRIQRMYRVSFTSAKRRIGTFKHHRRELAEGWRQ